MSTQHEKALLVTGLFHLVAICGLGLLYQEKYTRTKETLGQRRL